MYIFPYIYFFAYNVKVVKLRAVKHNAFYRIYKTVAKSPVYFE